MAASVTIRRQATAAHPLPADWIRLARIAIGRRPGLGI
jgi:hypothetical protein